MADPFTDELRALRERAYGPDADIHDDAAALARLHELEDRAAERDLERPEFADAEGAGIVGSSDVPPTQDAPAPVAMDPVAPAGPWWKRRMPRLWALSLVAAVLLGAAATLSVQALQAGRVALLMEDDNGVWPDEGWGPRPPDGRVFEEFFGLSTIAMPQYVGDGTISTCLYVFGADSAMIGWTASGCGAGSFPATAALVVSAQAPAELLERFPEDTALQFVLDGERVAVYADSP